MSKKQINQVTFTSLQEAHGEIPYNMTNDYMFRAVLQKNRKVLLGLVSSLLRLNPSDIQSIEITNPIELGSSVGDKEFWLDVTLFPEYPEFYATYKFQNVINHNVYSDNLQLRVVELNQIHLATEEDKQYSLDYWASLFKSKTWEELKAMAIKNEYFNETVKTIYELSSDFKIREACRRREEHKRQISSYERKLLEKDSQITEKDNALAQKDATIAEKNAAIAEKDAIIANLQKQLLEQKQ